MNLRDWFSGRARRPLNHLRFEMFTRQGCHLCDFAWQVLENARQQYGFVLTKTDVDSKPELAARYGMEVPVVTVNGRVRFRGAINLVLLDRLLRAEARRPGSAQDEGG